MRGRPKQGMFRRVSCKDGSIGDTGACWKEGREVSLVRLPACALSLSLSVAFSPSLNQRGYCHESQELPFLRTDAKTREGSQCQRVIVARHC